MEETKEPSGAHRRAGNGPVSRPELEKLEAQRAKPAPARALTPNGCEHVHALEQARLAARERHVRATLDQQKGQATTGFALGQTMGVAKDGFERTR